MSFLYFTDKTEIVEDATLTLERGTLKVKALKNGLYQVEIIRGETIVRKSNLNPWDARKELNKMKFALGEKRKLALNIRDLKRKVVKAEVTSLTWDAKKSFKDEYTWEPLIPTLVIE